MLLATSILTVRQHQRKMQLVNDTLVMGFLEKPFYYRQKTNEGIDF